MKTQCVVLILETKNEFRVAFIDDVRDIQWRKMKDTEIQYEERDQLTPDELKYFFGACQVFTEKEKAWHEAVQLYRDQSNVGQKFVSKNQIQFVVGFESVEFPK